MAETVTVNRNLKEDIMKTYETEATKMTDREYERMVAAELAREKARKEVSAAEANFAPEAFVKLCSGWYRKNAVVVVRFLDDTIHVRFSNGDIVAVTTEELTALTT